MNQYIVDLKVALVKKLWECGAVKSGMFMLKSGKQSDIYCDLKLASLHPRILSLMVQCWGEILQDIQFDSLGCDEGPGVNTMLGALLQHWASWHPPVPSSYEPTGFVIRKTVKAHGTQKEIEGVVGQGPVLLEDVATTGGSMLTAIAKMPVKPVAALVVIDRGDGAPEALRELGINLYSVLTLDEIRQGKP